MNKQYLKPEFDVIPIKGENIICGGSPEGTPATQTDPQLPPSTPARKLYV